MYNEPTVPRPVTATERLPLLPDVERIFDAFVENANAVGGQARTMLGALPEPNSSESGSFLSQKTVLADLPIHLAGETIEPAVVAPLAQELRRAAYPAFDNDPERAYVPTRGDTNVASAPQFGAPYQLSSSSSAGAPVPAPVPVPLPAAGPPGVLTATTEAARLVPDVASVRPRPAPARERGEDGQIPPRELESMMGDMAVLLRYGHDEEVSRRLLDLRKRYSQDLLLLRRIAEFHLEMGSTDLVKETLFELASGLFSRRNFTGMKAALEQVLVLSPNDERATKLLGLLERR